MDSSTSSPTAAVRFGPDRRLTAAAAAGALAAVALAFTTDAAGRLLFGLAALLLAGYVAGDLLWWPRLAADATGVRVHTPFLQADFGWDEVHDVRADVRARHGLRTTTLEVDAGGTLVVFSRRSLGADPEAVAGQVRALRPMRR